MDDEALQKLGLTKGESAVYLALLELGESTAGVIAKKAGVSSSKVYEILERLMAKGLAGRVSKSGRMLFSASDPKALERMVAEKKKELDEQEKALISMLPSLMILFRLGSRRYSLGWYLISRCRALSAMSLPEITCFIY